jgi:hypothetical protein
MPVVWGRAKEDNEVMGEMGKRGTANSSDRRCIDHQRSFGIQGRLCSRMYVHEVESLHVLSVLAGLKRYVWE